MAQTINTWDGLENALGKVLKNIVSETGESVKETIQKNLNDAVYDTPEGDYDRTHDLYDSITKDKVQQKNIGNLTNPSLYNTVVHFDPDKILPRDDRSRDLLKPHQSVDFSLLRDGERISILLPKWINEGTENSPYYNITPTNYFTTSLNDIFNNQNYKKNINDYIKVAGYNAKFVK